MPARARNVVTMNLRRWLKQSRIELARSTVAVFGECPAPEGQSAEYIYGTGFLVSFRGVPVMVTCEHVLRPIGKTVYATTGRHMRQSTTIHKDRLYEKRIDLGVAVLNDSFAPGEKLFLDPADAVLQDIDPGESVLVYGFPTGHPDLQRGGIVDGARGEAWFTSMTYLSLTETAIRKRYNDALQDYFPTIEWAPANHRNFKDFLPLRIPPGEDIDRHGFSGGPVFLANSRQLIGYVTHVKPSWFFFIPIRRAFEALDQKLNVTYEIQSHGPTTLT